MTPDPISEFPLVFDRKSVAGTVAGESGVGETSSEATNECDRGGVAGALWARASGADRIFHALSDSSGR